MLGNVEHVDDAHTADTGAALAAMAAADDHPNPSLLAIRDAYDQAPGWALTDTVPFSSARKWSAAAFDGHGAWLLGAPDILLTRAGAGPVAEAAADRLQHWAERGRRVLLLARAPEGLDRRRAPDGAGSRGPRRARREAAGVRPRDHGLLRPPAPRGEDHLGRQPHHRRGGGGPVRRGRRRPPRRCPHAARGARGVGRRRRAPRRVRPGHSPSEAGHGPCPAGPGSRGGHDRRRRERHPRPQGRRHRRGHGLGQRRRHGRWPDSCCSTTTSPCSRRWCPRAAGSSPTSSGWPTCS